MTSEEQRPTHRRRRSGAAVIAPTEPPPGHEELVGQVRAYPRRRNYLLPALQDVQFTLGWLPPWSLELIGAHLRVPKSEVYGVASSFPGLAAARAARVARAGMPWRELPPAWRGHRG